MAEKVKKDKTPVYRYPRDYAVENNELEAYRNSLKTNIACKEAIETAVNHHYDGYRIDTSAVVGDVVKKFGYERTLYVLAATVRDKEWDGRFSRANKDWAHTIPVFENKDQSGHNLNFAFVVQSHPGLTNMVVAEARHAYLLSLPLKREDIKAEAAKILSQFQEAREPNSPDKTCFAARISTDFLARAKAKDTDRLMSMLPFQSLSIARMEGERGTFALISKDENRFQKLQLRKPSVLEKLREPLTAPAEPKPPARSKSRQPER